MSTDWRNDLAAQIARGLAESGHADVVAELGDHLAALADHPDAPIEPFRPAAPVLATLSCASGFLGVLGQTDGRISVHLARTPHALLEQVRETVEPVLVVDADGPGGPHTRETLAREGLTVPAWFSGSGFTEADLLAACAAVLAA